MIVTLPPDTPVTTPEELTIAIDPSDELHVPPVVPSVRWVVA